MNIFVRINDTLNLQLRQVTEFWIVILEKK